MTIQRRSLPPGCALAAVVALAGSVALADGPAGTAAGSVPVARVDAAAAGTDTVPAAASARQVLAQVLQVGLAEVELAELEHVQWGDACLGVTRPDVMCAQVATPGYRIAYDVAGARYLLHTDLLGGTVLLAGAPELDLAEAVASWHGAGPDGECLQAHVLANHIAVGRCHGPLLPGGFVRAEHREALHALASRFAATEVETVDGILRIAGRGDETWTAPRARAAAELVRAMAFEAAAGRTGASWTVALTYHEPQGERCADPTAQLQGRVLTVASSGLASVWACRDGAVVPLVTDAPLADARLARLYEALDRFGAVESARPEDGDAMPRLTFAGRGFEGIGAVGAEAVAELEAWARDLLHELEEAALGSRQGP